MHPDNDILRPEQIFTADDDTMRMTAIKPLEQVQQERDAAEVRLNYEVLKDPLITLEIRNAALYLIGVLPPSRHRNLALTALEEAAHWAIAAHKRQGL